MVPIKPRKHRGFLMLEVLLAIMIIGIALVALIRGFIISLDSIKRIKQNEQAVLLARTLLDDMMLEPPAEGRFTGRFEEDPRFGADFAGWRWAISVEEERIRYDEDPGVALRQDLEVLHRVQLLISFQGERDRNERIFLALDTYLLEPEIFSDSALQRNQLF